MEPIDEMSLSDLIYHLDDNTTDSQDRLNLAKDWSVIHFDTISKSEAGDILRSLNHFCEVPKTGPYKDRLQEVCDPDFFFITPLGQSSSSPERSREQEGRRKRRGPGPWAPQVILERGQDLKSQHAPISTTDAELSAMKTEIQMLKRMMVTTRRPQESEIESALRQAASGEPPSNRTRPLSAVVSPRFQDLDDDVGEDSPTPDPPFFPSRTPRLQGRLSAPRPVSSSSHPKAILQPRTTRCLQVTKEREANNMHQSIKAHHRSMQTYVQSTDFLDNRNKKEAQSLARTLDLFLDQYGDKQVAEVDCLETIFRRLEAVIYADWSGDWETASQIEELPERWSAGSHAMIMGARKAARISRTMSHGQSQTDSQSEEELSSSQKRRLRRKRVNTARNQSSSTTQTKTQPQPRPKN